MYDVPGSISFLQSLQTCVNRAVRRTILLKLLRREVDRACTSNTAHSPDSIDHYSFHVAGITESVIEVV